ncbi:MAG TPA: hypothetical protein VF338_01510 [Leptolinea sp.]
MNSQSYSSDLLEIFQKGVREIISKEQLQSIFHLETFEELIEIPVEKIVKTAEKNLNYQSANGLFFRFGSAAFKHLVRKHGRIIGIDSLEFRLQPQRKRLMDGIGKLILWLESCQAADFSSQQSGDDVTINLTVVENAATNTGGRTWLHFIAGLFQAYLYWAGGGKQYPFQIVSQASDKGEITIQFRLMPVD